MMVKTNFAIDMVQNDAGVFKSYKYLLKSLIF